MAFPYNKAAYFWFECNIHQINCINGTNALSVDIYLNNKHMYCLCNNNNKKNVIRLPISNKANNSYEILFKISGKKDHHTLFNTDGSMQSSTSVIINDITISGVNLSVVSPNVISAAKIIQYQHNYNGDGDLVREYVGGELILGFNGLISLVFTTPIYDWLLHINDEQ